MNPRYNHVFYLKRIKSFLDFRLLDFRNKKTFTFLNIKGTDYKCYFQQISIYKTRIFLVNEMIRIL